MGRCNMQHPKTKQWRCWSTYVDNWITDWMDEEDYKKWLIEDAARSMENSIKQNGITKPHFLTVDECTFTQAKREMCDKCNKYGDACDTCGKNMSLKEYKDTHSTFLNIELVE